MFAWLALTSVVASASSLEPLPIAVLAEEVRGVALLEGGESPLVWAFTASGIVSIDPLTGALGELLPIPGVDAIALGPREALVCGGEGLWRVDREAPEAAARVDETPCEAIAAGDDGHFGVIGEGMLRRGRYDAEGLAWLDVSPLPAGPPALAARGLHVAGGAIGAEGLVVIGPEGVSRLATGGPIGGLAAGPRGWTWSLPARDLLADNTHSTQPTAPRPGPLVAIDLDDGGTPRIVTLHAAEGQLSLPDTLEGTLSLELPARQLRAADVDGDGCPDLVVASSFAVQTLRSTLCPGVALQRHPEAARAATSRPASTPYERSSGLAPGLTVPPPAHRIEPPTFWRPAPSTRTVLGADLPDFLGPGAVPPGERQGTQQHLTVSYGWVMGGTLAPTLIQIPAFPSLAMAWERGSPWVRGFAGVDTAGLFFWITEDGGGIHLINGTAGVLFGSPRLRAGPFVTAGVWNAGAGLRLVATPWRERRNLYRGFETRLTWFAPATGQVSVLYTLSEARGEPDRIEAGTSPRPPDPARTGIGACSEVEILAGALIGGSSTADSWEYVGSTVPIEVRGSPAIALGCDTGRRSGLFLGVETAPIFAFLTPGDARRFHMGSWTVGAMSGSDRVRVGPIGTVGIWALGGGARLAVDVARSRHGFSHRVEARALALAFSAPAGEAWLMYGVAYDPRR